MWKLLNGGYNKGKKVADESFPKLRLVRAPQPKLEDYLIDPENDMEVIPDLSEALVSALQNPNTQNKVDLDMSNIRQRLMNNPDFDYKPSKIVLSRLDQDREGLSAVFSSKNELVYLPGVIGLEGLDNVAPINQDRCDLVRLYCGVYLAHNIVRVKYYNEKFFERCFSRQFSLRPGVNGVRVDNISRTFDDPVIQARHLQISLASFASGAAISTIFPDPQLQENMIKILREKYEAEIGIINKNLITMQLILNREDIHVADDTYPSDSRGFAYPHTPQVIQTVLQGRLSKS